MDIANKLFSIAQNSCKNAYAPYSRFKVGAALYAGNKQIYTGCNVENISFPCGTCAEANAIAAMVVGGSVKILEILIYADSTDLITPCGACLQRIAEFGDNDTKIYLANANGIQQTLKLQDLLPHVFQTKDLQK